MTFGQAIADARKKAGLSQKELAARIRKDDGQPISPQYLNDIEHDRRNPPSDLIDRFAEALGISKNMLYLRAGELPDEFKAVQADEARVDKAFQAFRRVLTSSR